MLIYYRFADHPQLWPLSLAAKGLYGLVAAVVAETGFESLRRSQILCLSPHADEVARALGELLAADLLRVESEGEHGFVRFVSIQTEAPIRPAPRPPPPPPPPPPPSSRTPLDGPPGETAEERRKRLQRERTEKCRSKVTVTKSVTGTVTETVTDRYRTPLPSVTDSVTGSVTRSGEEEKKKRKEEDREENKSPRGSVTDRYRALPTSVTGTVTDSVTGSVTSVTESVTPSQRYANLADDGLFGTSERIFLDALTAALGAPQPAFRPFERTQLVDLYQAHAGGRRGPALEAWIRETVPRWVAATDRRFAKYRPFNLSEWLGAACPDSSAASRARPRLAPQSDASFAGDAAGGWAPLKDASSDA